MKRLVITGTAFIAIVYALGRFSFGLFLPDIRDAMGLSEASSGLIASAAYAGYCIALLLAESLVRALGGRGTLLLAGGSVLGGLLLIGGALQGYSLAAGLALTGFSSGLASPAYGAVVQSRLEPGRRDRANTWINSGTSWGLIVLGPLASAMHAYWRWAYFAFAVLAAVIMIVQWRLLTPSGAEQKRQGPGMPDGWWRKGVTLMGASLAVGAVSSIYWTFSTSLVQAQHGLTEQTAAWLWLVMGGAGVLGGFAGTVVERLGQGTAYRYGGVVLVLSLLGITLPGAPLAFLSAGLFGIAYIFLTGVFIVWGTRCFPRHAAFGISLSFLFLGMGQFGGSMAAGTLIEATSYSTAFLCFGALGIAGLAIRAPRSN